MPIARCGECGEVEGLVNIYILRLIRVLGVVLQGRTGPWTSILFVHACDALQVSSIARLSRSWRGNVILRVSMRMEVGVFAG